MGQIKSSAFVKMSPGCIFCGNATVSETSVWPNWLDGMFPDHEVACSASEPGARSACSLSAKLACDHCNTGWMSGIGDEVQAFLTPALRGEPTTLSPENTSTLAAWLCLTAIKAASLTSHCSVPPDDRAYLLHEKRPNRNWSIFAAGLSQAGWARECTHYPFRIEFSGHPRATHSRGREIPDCNTQLMSFGMGALFFQVFTSPSLLFLNDFAVAAKDQGLTQVWPAVRRFGMLTHRPLVLPPALKLTDEEAARAADSFAGSLRRRLPNAGAGTAPASAGQLAF